MIHWILLSFFLCGLATAGTVVIERKQQSFNNVDCELNDTCGLKEFNLIEEKKKTTISGNTSPAYSTDVRFILKTSENDDVTEYGIVQWIRGCQYTSDSSGKKKLDISRHYMHGMSLFKHPSWSIDSDSEDPVYTSYNNNRHALLRYNQNPKSFNPETAKFFKPEALPHPVVFATDLPGSFSANGSSAKNSSLEFEVCVFKMKDLPLHSTPDGDGIFKGDAIKCFKWESKFRYDFRKRDYVMGGAIDPVCLDK